MATQSSILVWTIPWTQESCGLQSMRWQRVRHDCPTKQAGRGLCIFTTCRARPHTLFCSRFPCLPWNVWFLINFTVELLSSTDVHLGCGGIHFDSAHYFESHGYLYSFCQPLMWCIFPFIYIFNVLQDRFIIFSIEVLLYTFLNVR